MSHNKMFLDIETIGLPRTRGFDNYYDPSKLKYYETSRMVEIAYFICNDKGKKIKTRNILVKPCDFKINNSHIHGITTDMAISEGKPINYILKKISKDLDNVSEIISHNILFDLNILLSECYRNNSRELIKKIKSKKQNCTMRMGKKFMKSSKSPRLMELYKYLRNNNKNYTSKHRALPDARICKRCYYLMKK